MAFWKPKMLSTELLPQNENKWEVLENTKLQLKGLKPRGEQYADSWQISSDVNESWNFELTAEDQIEFDKYLDALWQNYEYLAMEMVKGRKEYIANKKDSHFYVKYAKNLIPLLKLMHFHEDHGILLLEHF